MQASCLFTTLLLSSKFLFNRSAHSARPTSLTRVLWCFLGVPWAFLGCLKVSLEAPVEHSGGLVGVPGVLLVALRGFIRFWVALGAVSGKIQEILGSQNGAQNEKIIPA